MSIEFFITPGYGEKLRESLPYSQAVRIGNRVEISGQAGVDGDLNIPASLEDEIVLAFDNVERTLATAGATWGDVVHVNSYHVISEPDSTFAVHNDIIAAQFRERMPERSPIWTETGVTALGLPEMRIEIRVTAVIEN